MNSDINEETATLELIFSPKNTASHFIQIYKSNIEALRYGILLAENSSGVPTDFMKNEEDFIKLQIDNPLSKEELDATLKKILINKSFEDLIKGINLTLCDGYHMLLTCKEMLDGKPKSLKDIEELKNNYYKRAQNMPFPKLIEKMEQILGEKIKYKDEILTINNVRTCLVHRNGVVLANKDINNKGNNTLELKYLKMTLTSGTPNNMEEKNHSFTLNSGETAKLSFPSMSLEFHPNDDVLLNYKFVFDVGITCYLFIEQLVKTEINYLKNNPMK
ncbi:MAG: hypothetical protein AB1Z23_01755 [Eubacteriales bacterium]